jgi:hypothetical protein
MNTTVSFAIDDDVRLRAYIGAIGSAVGILIAVLPICVMLFHPYYKGSLRLNFNWMLVITCLLHIPVAFARMAASVSLLRGTMTKELCNITGAINAAGESSEVWLLLAFYWSFLTLRLTAIRRVYDKLVPRPWHEHFGVVFATVTGLGIGAIEASAYTLAKGDVHRTTGTNFDLDLGWCAAGTIPERSYAASGIIAMSLMPFASVACVIALRCDYCLGLAIRQRLGLFSHWPIYVRFFGIVLYSSVYSTLVTMHEFRSARNLMLPSTILSVLWGPVLAGIFLFTEGIPQVVIYRLVKKVFHGSSHHSERTRISTREVTTNSYRYGVYGELIEEEEEDEDASMQHDPGSKLTAQSDNTVIETSDPHFARRQSEVAMSSGSLSERRARQFAFPREYFTYTKGGGFTNMVCTLMGIERSHGLLMVTAETQPQQRSSLYQQM